jgi:hypothetical protein
MDDFPSYHLPLKFEDFHGFPPIFSDDFPVDSADFPSGIPGSPLLEALGKTQTLNCPGFDCSTNRQNSCGISQKCHATGSDNWRYLSHIRSILQGYVPGDIPSTYGLWYSTSGGSLGCASWLLHGGSKHGGYDFWNRLIWHIIIYNEANH